MRVLVVGAASWNTVLHVDALPDGRPGRIIARRSYDVLGGTAAGKAVNLAALGHEVHLHTLLADDEAGARVRAALADAGVRAGAVAGALSVTSETLASPLLSAELLDRETAEPAGSASG